MAAVADRERARADRGREAVHLDGVARPGAQVIERDAHLPRSGQGVAPRAQQVGQLAQHAEHFALLLRLSGAQRVAELDDLGGLDEHGGSGRRLVVDDAAHAAAGGRADGDDVAAAPQRHGGVGRAVGRVEGAEQRLEPGDEALAYLPHVLARAGQRPRRRIEHGALGVDGLRESLLEFLGRWLDPQRRGARGVASDTP